MKRIVSVLIIIAFCFNGIAILAADNGKSGDANYQKALDVLVALDIISLNKDGKYDFDNVMTRGDFALAVTRMLGMQNNGDAVTASHRFTDVDANDPNAVGIDIASTSGIMTGNDGCFLPDEPITLNQALKVIVSVLGYEIYATNKGGYPVGYSAVAFDKKISIGISSVADEELVNSDALILLYNALGVDILEPSVYGEKQTYTTTSGKNILTDQNIYKHYGVVNANSMTSLVSAKNYMGKSHVKIDDYILDVGKTNAASYLGYRVEFYAKEEESREAILLYISPYRNNLLKINGDNVLDVEKTVSGGIVMKYDPYDNNNFVKHQNADISPYAYIIYNGRAATDVYTLDDLKPECGKVTLIDNNNNGIYDVVLINKYDMYVIDRVNVQAEIITDKYMQDPLILKESIYSGNVYIEFKGVRIDVVNLEEWDVLSVMVDKDNEYYSILVTNDSFSGKIESIIDEQNVTVDGKSYKISPNYTTPLLLGADATFYLNDLGEISAVSIQSENLVKYGYMVNVAQERGLDGEVKIHLITDSGEEKIYDVASRLTVNSVNKVRKDIVAMLSDDEGKPKPQLIRYNINSSEKLSELYYTSAVESEGFKNDDDKSLTLHTPSGRFRYVHFCFVAQTDNFAIDSSTTIMYIPYDKKNVNHYKIMKASDFNLHYYYHVSAYNVNSVGVASAVMVHERSAADTEIVQQERLIVVDKITDFVDDDGNIAKKLFYYQGVTYGERVLADGAINVNLQRGDIIRFALNSRDEILSVSIEFFKDEPVSIADQQRPVSYPNLPVNTQNGWGQTATSGYRLLYGEIFVREKTIARFIYGATANTQNGMREKNEVINLSRVSIMVYNSVSDKVYPGTLDDIITVTSNPNGASKVVIRQQNGDTIDLVIYI